MSKVQKSKSRFIGHKKHSQYLIRSHIGLSLFSQNKKDVTSDRESDVNFDTSDDSF